MRKTKLESRRLLLWMEYRVFGVEGVEEGEEVSRHLHSGRRAAAVSSRVMRVAQIRLVLV